MTLEEAIKTLREVFKDEPLLRIYYGKEANDLYQKYIDSTDSVMDEEWVDTTGYICSDFETSELYLEGAYFLEVGKDGNPYISSATYPDNSIVGMDNIVKYLNYWKKNTTKRY